MENKSIKLGKCWIRECCSHIYPVRVIKTKDELTTFEEVYDAFDFDEDVLGEYEDYIVELEIKVIGKKEDLYGK